MLQKLGIALIAAIEQSQCGELFNQLKLQAAQGSHLRSGIGPNLLVWDGLSGPFEEMPLTCDRDTIGLCEADAL